MLKEDLTGSQRVEAFDVFARLDCDGGEKYRRIARSTVIGSKRILTFKKKRCIQIPSASLSGSRGGQSDPVVYRTLCVNAQYLPFDGPVHLSFSMSWMYPGVGGFEFDIFWRFIFDLFLIIQKGQLVEDKIKESPPAEPGNIENYGQDQ